MIIGIDPGSSTSGVVMVTGTLQKLDIKFACSDMDNGELVDSLKSEKNLSNILVIEDISGRSPPGMQMPGKYVVGTAKWIGRFHQAWPYPEEVIFIHRAKVRWNILKTNKGGDAAITKILEERYGKKIAGIKKHALQALALVITHLECCHAKVE